MRPISVLFHYWIGWASGPQTPGEQLLCVRDCMQLLARHNHSSPSLHEGPLTMNNICFRAKTKHQPAIVSLQQHTVNQVSEFQEQKEVCLHVGIIRLRSE